jgi:predicted kinase
MSEASKRGVVRLIGGASAAGKSTVAKVIARELGVPLIELDLIFDAISNCEAATAATSTQGICETLLSGLVSAGANCVVEGGWIQPEIAEKYRGAGLQAVFCGYPNATAEDRLKAMQGGHHWMTKIDPKDAIRLLEKQIKDSNSYRVRAEKLSFDFIDFGDISAGTAAMRSKFL